MEGLSKLRCVREGIVTADSARMDDGDEKEKRQSCKHMKKCLQDLCVDISRSVMMTDSVLSNTNSGACGCTRLQRYGDEGVTY